MIGDTGGWQQVGATWRSWRRAWGEIGVAVKQGGNESVSKNSGVDSEQIIWRLK